jgi:hypothetical protein
MNALGRSGWKETLALAPMWIVSCLAVAAAPLWSGFRLEIVSLAAYVFGSVALGAHAFGHEYAHRTLGALLVQPVRRTRILSVKLAVLAVMLIALAAVAWIGPYSPIKLFPMHTTFDSRVLFLPTLMGLTLAPYLSLLARSTLGGAVFTVAVPGLLLIASDLIGLRLFGLGSPGEIDRFKYAAFPLATVATCAFAAIAIWPRVLRLEDAGDGAGHISVSIASDARASRPRSARNPYWLLAAKEIRLQQMTFVIVAIYLFSWLASIWAHQSIEGAPPTPWWQLNILYAVLLSILIGSLASAEERQFGTLEWQALLPLAAWKQFAMKVAVACGIALAAGIALPILLALVTPRPIVGGFPPGALWFICMITLGTTIGSLYVSTLSSSGVRAVATALPVLAGAVILFQGVNFVLWRAFRAGLLSRGWVQWGHGSELRTQATLGVIVFCVAAVLVVHAFRNHSRFDQGWRRVAPQAAAIAGVMTAAAFVVFVLGLR